MDRCREVRSADLSCQGVGRIHLSCALRSKEKVRSHGISYTRARELIKDAFRGLTDVSKIGVHSLRAGGATSAANADRLIDYLSVMVVGRVKTPRMAMLKTILILVYRSRNL